VKSPLQESFLHYLWAHRRYDDSSLLTTQGNEIVVLSPGEFNRDAGPDFLHARLLIDGLQWVGNVELHIRSSDWQRHNHSVDPSYSNCILHVVWEDDQPVRRQDDQPLLTLVLKDKVDVRLMEDYQALMQRDEVVACRDVLPVIRTEVIHQWSERMAIERLEVRTGMMRRYLDNTRGHWEEAFYHAMARGFGFSLNGDPFERLARSVPFTLMLRLRDRPDQLAALYYGMAGFLHGRYLHPQLQELRSEFEFLLKKWSLEAPHGLGWKFMRMRPANFPTVRLSQFISLYHTRTPVFSNLMESQSLEQLEEMLTIRTQVVPPVLKASQPTDHMLGRTSIRLLLINTVIPFLFLKGRSSGDLALCDKAVGYLEDAGPEDHAVIRTFIALGIRPRHAADTQGLLHLYREYCSPKKCLNCEIGNQVLCRSATQEFTG
jgi:hypothetical protein